MTFEFNNTSPIYIQLVEQMKIKIISGKLLPLTRLPSVRELALIAKVNPNTAQKALLELEEMGLIFTERTNGKFVTHDTELIEKYKKEYADSLCRKFIADMKSLGFSKEAAINYTKTQEEAL